MQLRLVGAGLAVIASLSLGALGADVPPMEIIELGPRAIVVRVADASTANQTLAVATRAGIILVDSQRTSALAQECRRLVAEHFGRTDFRYLILTHEDMDHIGGTGAFPDVTIVAQEACAQVMRSLQNSLRSTTTALRAWDENRKAQLEIELSGADPLSARAAELRAEVQTLETCIADFIAGAWTPRIPDVTFAETWTLDAGDTKVTCWFLGVGHSRSDILIHFETEGVLCVGDAMQKMNICLGVDPELARAISVPHWCQTLALALEKPFDTVAWGHRGLLTHLDVANRAGYIQALWDGVVCLKSAGARGSEAGSSLLLAELYPNLGATVAEMADLLGVPEAAVMAEAEAQHAANIDLFWAAAR